MRGTEYLNKGVNAMDYYQLSENLKIKKAVSISEANFFSFGQV